MATLKTITNISQCFHRHILRSLRNYSRITSNGFATKPHEDYDAPIKYTTSTAAKMPFERVYSGRVVGDVSPWYQPIVISVSLTFFLVYFCILREENDIDGKLSLTLYDHIEGLEEVQLKICLQHNKENGLDTKDIERRLAEINDEKNQKQ